MMVGQAALLSPWDKVSCVSARRMLQNCKTVLILPR